MMKGTGKTNYVVDSVVRKHVLARQQGTVGWEECGMKTLMSLSVDQCHVLKSLPSSWTASEASLLICHQPDWPLLVSMFTCLWHDVVESVPEAEAVLTVAQHDGQAHTALKEFQQQHGFRHIHTRSSPS